MTSPPSTRVLSLLQVSPAGDGGGAEAVARALHRGFLERGQDAWLAVGRRPHPEQRVIRISAGHGAWARFWWNRHAAFADAGRPRAALAARAFVAPGALWDAWRGREDFRYPDTRSLLQLTPAIPDVAVLHNLHGGYFDLRQLPRLSAATEVLLSPHDLWLATGHCAHALDGDRWEHGCGSCPHLLRYPAVRRDDTHRNWLRKQDIYARSTVRVIAPSRWLLARLERSVLAPAIVDSRVVPYGVDLTVFRPGDSAAARSRLGLRAEARVLVMAGRSLRTNVWKDFETLKAALSALGTPTTLLVLGDDGPTEVAGRGEIRFVGDAQPGDVADYLRAADVYVHPARADTFPLGVLEALATGTPVVATVTGGIPEQVRDRDTGLLVPERSPRALADALETILADAGLRARLGAAAATDASDRFDLEDQISAHLEWYAELAASRRRQPVVERDG